MRASARSSSGSGLTANRTNLLDASGLYFAPTYLPVRLNQRFAIDPRSPSLRHFAMQRVTSLEPRTPHQPGKLQKLSKNEFVFTPFIFTVNKKTVVISAAKSTECRPSTTACHIFVHCAGQTPAAPSRMRFARCYWAQGRTRTVSSTVKIRQNPRRKHPFRVLPH